MYEVLEHVQAVEQEMRVGLALQKLVLIVGPGTLFSLHGHCPTVGPAVIENQVNHQHHHGIEHQIADVSKQKQMVEERMIKRPP